jgi:hypothetical protein
VNRRAFLRLGAITPALLALERLPLLPRAARAAVADPEPILSPESRRVLLAVIERVVDTGEPHAPKPSDVGAVERIEQLLSVSDPDVSNSLGLALRLVQFWPAVVELRFRRFSSLDDSEKDESLEGWRRSRIELRRRVFEALRSVALYGYWSAPATWPLIGYGGPLIGSLP